MFNLHPFLRRLLARPSLLIEHAGAYGELAGVELGAWRLGLQRALMWGVLAVALGGLSVLSALVSLLLAAAVPTAQMPAPWILVLVPVAILAGALTSAWLAWRAKPSSPLSELRRQWQLDMAHVKAQAAA